MGLYDDLAGTADHLAGSTDEAVARQFDDEAGGGFADADTWRSAAEDDGSGVYDTIAGSGEAILDVPADAINATTGTGENLGWFGEIDRKLDPRSWDGEEPDWAEPSDANDGISGFAGATTQVGGHVTDEATKGAAPALMKNPKLLALAVLALLLVLAPYANIAANVSE